MATKQLLLLAVATLVFASVADSKINIDPVSAKSVAAAFQEAMKEEQPLLEEEIRKAQTLKHKALVHTHLRSPKDAPVAELSASDSGEWASDFERDVSELVMGLSKGGLAATPMGNSVQKIADLIQKDMMPKVLAAHAANQKALDKLAKDLASCGSTKNLELAAADKRKVTYQASSKSHKSCRSTEASLYSENVDCRKEWRAAKDAKELKCKAYLEISKKYGDSQRNHQIVSKAGSEDVESYLTRITGTICGKPGGGKPPAPPCGMLCDFTKYKIACEEATKKYNDLVKKCKALDKKWNEKRKACDNIQDTMDGASCKWATETKDACESYSGCYIAKKTVYDALVEATTSENKNKTASEPDRKAEWRGLKRMQCLITAFGDGSVTAAEVVACKNKTHSTDHLTTVYPKLPALEKCVVPNLFPTTADYKKAEFVPLPTLAKGKLDANECSSLKVVSITPATGSPGTCKCERVSMNGPWSPGSMVKCSNCLDVSNSKAKNSCPDGTKLFSPRSRQDWETFLKSASPLRAPNWIVDVTRPFNGCVDCAIIIEKKAGDPTKDEPAPPMNSENAGQQKAPFSQRWMTTDGSPWWLRSSGYLAPTGDYNANCYFDLLGNPSNANSVTFKDNKCNYHSKSYYCQPVKLSLKPKAGSPTGCTCKKVELMGQYSAQVVIKCERCLDVYKSKDKNSCPSGTKIFSPRSRADWKTFLRSAIPLRAPHWIIDVTRPQNGCGGCTDHVMNSGVAAQRTWVTSDGSPWWLRSTSYHQPNGDYLANCYMDLWGKPANENSLAFDDGNCNFHSRSYYCQSLKTTTTTTTTTPKPKAGKELKYMSSFKTYSHRSSNFHPQGMCYDPKTKNLALQLQSDRYIRFLDANNGASKGSISTGMHHSTSVACSPTDYYIADYTGNSGMQDMYKVTRAGSKSNYGSLKVGYGGFPLVVVGSQMVRTEHSTTYNWNNLDELKFSSLSTPDSITASTRTGISGGIGGLCYSGLNIFALGWTTSTGGFKVHRLNDKTNTLESTFSGSCSSGSASAIACSSTELWVYCWVNTNSATGATINKYSLN